MKYDIINDVLVVTGCFEVLSTGVGGGRKRVKHILNIQVPHDFSHADPEGYVGYVARSLNLGADYVALLTAVAMKNLQIVKDDYVTVFATAGVTNPSSFGTINLIIISARELSEGGMASAIITATEAKTSALFEIGFTFTGTTTDAVVVAYERASVGEVVSYAGPSTDFGKNVARLVIHGVKSGLDAQHGKGLKELLK